MKKKLWLVESTGKKTQCEDVWESDEGGDLGKACLAGGQETINACI